MKWGKVTDLSKKNCICGIIYLFVCDMRRNYQSYTKAHLALLRNYVSLSLSFTKSMNILTDLRGFSIFSTKTT